MSVGERLRVGDVEGEAETSAARLGEQRVSVGDAAARDVHEQTAVGHK